MLQHRNTPAQHQPNQDRLVPPTPATPHPHPARRRQTQTTPDLPLTPSRQTHSTPHHNLARPRRSQDTPSPDLAPHRRSLTLLLATLAPLPAALTLLLALALPSAHAQWEIEDSGTTADLRGIHAVGAGIAWASGTHGTVLRTEDGGYLWQGCAIPPGADQLDFRGIQAFDENTAIVMSSGPGDQSRLYKTTDGCRTWKLLFTNPDPTGFWDAMKFTAGLRLLDGRVFRTGVVVGDPVDGQFSQFESNDNGTTWTKNSGPFFPAKAREGETLFAASNSSLVLTDHNGRMFVTGGASGSRSRILSEYVKHDPQVSVKFVGGDIPVASGASAGAFSIATSYVPNDAEEASAAKQFTVFFFPTTALCVVVGGDYKKPEKNSGTAAFSTNGGQHWKVAKTPPHGYRSSVAYDPTHNTWITVGPNGTDISTDDGKNWTALHPTGTEPGDADQHWNALSLPFVVGPHGRIGKLRGDALTQPAPPAPKTTRR